MKMQCTSCGEVLKLIQHPLLNDGKKKYVIHKCPNSLHPTFIKVEECPICQNPLNDGKLLWGNAHFECTKKNKPGIISRIISLFK